MSEASSVKVGQHRNGDHYARADIGSLGATGTIEGTGPSQEVAIDRLESNLRALAEWAEDAAEAMAIG